MSEKYVIWEEGEYTYPAAFGFVPNIHAYLHEDSAKRPCMIVVPGGGYRVASPTEGEIVAKRFYDAGFQAFVLTYTTNILGLEPLKQQPLMDLSRALRFVRARKEAFGILEDQVFVCGFSAGAHLTGSLAVHWMDVTDSRYPEVSNKPTGVILSYPVITSGEYAHRDSFVALCGENATEKELEYVSLEKQVTKQTPPVFLWQTVTDETVPVENSLLMANALQKEGISFEYHLFPKGVHGLSLSNDQWQRGEFGEPYTMDQIRNILCAIKNDVLLLSEDARRSLLADFSFLDPNPGEPQTSVTPVGTAVKEVAVWPDLAIAWMKELVKLI